MLFDAVKDQLRLFAVFLCGVLDEGDRILAPGGHVLRALNTIDQRCAISSSALTAPSYCAITASAPEFADLIDIGVMLNIWRHRLRWHSDFGRRKTNCTVIPQRRAFCQRLGNVTFHIDQL